jgi:DNA polymerase III sliding clamp (beta) subunit (PCNA family)
MIKEGKIRLEGQSEFGWIKESLSISYSGEPFSILVNPQFLRDMLEQSPSCVVGERSMKFTGSDWAHVVYMKVN